MPMANLLVVSLIVLAFVIFAATLLWGDYTSRGTRP
jgi:hypothetical protein